MIDQQDLNKYKVTELRQMLNDRGVIPKGLKADLVKQLFDILVAEESANSHEDNSQCVEQVEQNDVPQEQCFDEEAEQSTVVEDTVSHQNGAQEDTTQEDIPVEETSHNGHSTPVVEEQPLEEEQEQSYTPSDHQQTSSDHQQSESEAVLVQEEQRTNNHNQVEEDDDEVDEVNFKELNEGEFSRLNKNQKRKYKKKLRNKLKRIERDLIEKKKNEWSKIYVVKKDEPAPVPSQPPMKVEEVKPSEISNVEDEMEIDEEDMPEEDKEIQPTPEQPTQTQMDSSVSHQAEVQEVQEDIDEDDDFEEKVIIEYVPEQIEKDRVYLEFLNVFDKFSAVTHEEAVRLKQETMTDRERERFERQKLLELKKPKFAEDDDDDEVEDDKDKVSNRKAKLSTRMSVAQLKQEVIHPELVEMHDITAKDPVLLLQMKSTRNSVPVPRHWCFKRKYLQGKRGFEKPPFKLPDFIRKTGIQEMREAVQEKEDTKSLKNKMREKIRPKMGKIDIDYQKLHDAFFKWQTKPVLSIHGDLYYEGKEFETRLRDKKPGELNNELRAALGMPSGPNAAKCPPPWLIAMQRYGPPPSYPNLKIPGLNAPIPEGCTFGYHAGGWGKPPVDEYGRPLYGDVFGMTNTPDVDYEEEVDMPKWGVMEEDEDEDDDDDEEMEEDGEEDMDADDDDAVNASAEGLITPSGLNSVPAGIETPDMFELRKRKQQIEAEMESGENPALFTVIPEKSTDRINKDMMGSMHVYDFASLSKNTSSTAKTSKTSSGGGGIDVAIDPSELEDGGLDDQQLSAKYDQKMRESSGQNPHEDFSDMVADHAARQKKKKDAQDKGKSKKYQFKF